MKPGLEPPLWREEFSIHSGRDKYVLRRQFMKFLVLTSLGMFVGNVWIWVRSRFATKSAFPAVAVARAGEIPVDGVKLFTYPTPDAPCILVRIAADSYAAYSQKCTHLSCAVYYSSKSRHLECPCHEGHFSVIDGRVLQGPPPRPLPRIVLERRGDLLIATGIATEPQT